MRPPGMHIPLAFPRLIAQFTHPSTQVQSSVFETEGGYAIVLRHPHENTEPPPRAVMNERAAAIRHARALAGLSGDSDHAAA